MERLIPKEMDDLEGLYRPGLGFNGPFYGYVTAYQDADGKIGIHHAGSRAGFVASSLVYVTRDGDILLFHPEQWDNGSWYSATEERAVEEMAAAIIDC